MRDESGGFGPRLFLAEPDQSVCDGRVILLDLTGVETGKKVLHVRIANAHSSLLFAICRLYLEAEVTGTQSSYRWERLSKAKKEKLTRLNVFPPALLSDREKELYSRFTSSAVAPRGTADRDVRVRVLYRRRESRDRFEDPDRSGSYSRVEAGRRAVIPLPEGDQSVSLRFGRTFESRGHSDPVEVRISTFDRTARSRHDETIRLYGLDAEVTRAANGGVIEMLATGPLVVRVESSEHGDVTPNPEFLRMYSVEESSPVEYWVRSARGFDSVLKVSFRVESDSTEFESEYEFVGADGSVLESGSLYAETLPSPYDAVMDRNGGYPVSEPVPRYFHIPERAHRFRVLSSGDSVLVSAQANRPGGERTILVPEDSSAFHRSNIRERGWFPLRPVGHLELRRAGRSRSIRIQPRPPDWSSPENRANEDDLIWGQIDFEQGRNVVPILVPIPEGAEVSERLAGDDVRRDGVAQRARSVASSVRATESPWHPESSRCEVHWPN